MPQAILPISYLYPAEKFRAPPKIGKNIFMSPLLLSKNFRSPRFHMMIIADRLIQYKKSQTNTFQRPWGRLYREIPLGSKVALIQKVWMASRDYSVKPWFNSFNSKSLLGAANNSESFTWKSSQNENWMTLTLFDVARKFYKLYVFLCLLWWRILLVGRRTYFCCM